MRVAIHVGNIGRVRELGKGKWGVGGSGEGGIEGREDAFTRRDSFLDAREEFQSGYKSDAARCDVAILMFVL